MIGLEYHGSSFSKLFSENRKQRYRYHHSLVSLVALVGIQKTVNMEEVKDVMVRNLPLDLLGPELENLFSEVGPIKKVAVIHHKKKPGDGGQVSRGFGFVKFSLAADASEAVKQYNGKNIRGRNISVELTSKDKKGAKGATKPNGESINAAVQQQKQIKAISSEREENKEDKISNKTTADASSDAAATVKKKGGNLKASQQEIDENTQPVKHNLFVHYQP